MKKTLDLVARHIFALLLLLTLSISVVSKDTPTAEECGAVYEYLKWNTEVKGDKFKTNFHAKITILNKKGESYNDIVVQRGRFSKVKKLKATVFDADHNEVYSRNQKEFTLQCGYDGASVYSDICLYFSELSTAQFPYTIEYEYEKETSSLFFLSGAQFQRMIPVKSAEYLLSVPNDFRFRHRIRGLDIEPIITTDDGDEMFYFWQATDIPAGDDIEYAPPGTAELAKLQLVADKFSLKKYSLDGCTWENIGLWFNQLAQKKYNIEELLYQPIPSLELVDSLYNYVVDNVRYVAVQIGVGGWQPYSAERTESRKYGDCKDMSTLLVSKLRTHGIEAYQALALTTDAGLTDVDFPTTNFNHAITVAILDGDTLWMDPTCDNCPFGVLRSDVQNTQVLVATDEGGQIWRTKVCSATDNVATRVTSLVINKQLGIDITSELSLVGYAAVYVRSALAGKDNDETRRYVDRRFRGAGKKFKIDSYEISNTERSNLPVTIAIKATSIKPCRKIGNAIYVDPFFLNGLSKLERVELEDRSIPVNLYYPEIDNDLITVTWDSSLHIDSVVVPDSDTTSYPFGTFAVGVTQQPDSVNILMSRRYDAYTIRVDQFEDFETFRTRIKKNLSRHVKLITQ